MSARSRSRVFSAAAILFIMGCSLRASGANRKPVLLLHSGRVHPKPFSSKSYAFTPRVREEVPAGTQQLIASGWLRDQAMRIRRGNGSGRSQGDVTLA